MSQFLFFALISIDYRSILKSFTTKTRVYLLFFRKKNLKTHCPVKVFEADRPFFKEKYPNLLQDISVLTRYWCMAL